MKTNIIYVGDSYCASYKPRNPNSDEHPGVVYTEVDTHLNLAANKLGLRLYAYGYAGRAWFYSRYQLLQALKHYPDLITDAAAVVFFHTDAYRYNSVSIEINNGLSYGIVDAMTNNGHLVDPYRSWQRHLMDPEFQTWAQRAWFKEIDSICQGVKQIHFTVIKDTVPDMNLLSGVVYTTPLIELSMGELTGTDAEVLEQTVKDQRHNHFNAHNNQAIADLVVDAVTNHRTGFYPIDRSGFDLPNPNSSRYPCPGFGSK